MSTQNRRADKKEKNPRAEQFQNVITVQLFGLRVSEARLTRLDDYRVQLVLRCSLPEQTARTGFTSTACHPIFLYTVLGGILARRDTRILL